MTSSSSGHNFRFCVNINCGHGEERVSLLDTKLSRRCFSSSHYPMTPLINWQLRQDIFHTHKGWWEGEERRARKKSNDIADCLDFCKLPLFGEEMTRNDAKKKKEKYTPTSISVLSYFRADGIIQSHNISDIFSLSRRWRWWWWQL